MTVKSKVVLAAIAVLLHAFDASAGSRGGEILCEGSYPLHVQGVATDGSSIYWSFTRVLVKTDLSGKVLDKVDLGDQPVHMGDLCCNGGKVFVGMNMGSDRDGCRVGDAVWEYDGGNLKLLKQHPTPQTVWCNNGIEFYAGSFWVITSSPRHCRYNMVYRFTPDFRLLRCQLIDSGWTNLGVQAIFLYGDKMLFGCYGCEEDMEFPHKSCTLVVDGATLAGKKGSNECPHVVPCERRVEKSTAEGMLVLDGRLMAARSIRLQPIAKDRRLQRWTARLVPIDI